jgi:hypothetical protein
MARVVDFNPVKWAVLPGRTATSSHADWRLVGVACRLPVRATGRLPDLATRAFLSYRRSV